MQNGDDFVLFRLDVPDAPASHAPGWSRLASRHWPLGNLVARALGFQSPSWWPRALFVVARTSARRPAHRKEDERRTERCLARYSQEYLNHVIFASPEEVVLTAPDGSLGASERTAE